MRTKLIFLLTTALIMALGNVALMGCSSDKGYNKGDVIRVDIVQFSQDKELDAARNGVIQSIRESDLAKQATIKVDWADAGGQRLAIRPIIEKFERKKPDLLITLSTPCLEEAIRIVNATPVIFGVAINPKILGLNRGEEGYWRNMSGVYAEPPMKRLGEQIRILFPAARRIGVIWNPSEINSRYEMLALRRMSESMNFEIVEVRVRSAETIVEKMRNLITIGPDVIVLMSDNTVATAFSDIESLLINSKIPVVSDVTSYSQTIAVLATGFDLNDWGRATGTMAVKALSGESPKDIELKEFKALTTIVNLNIAKKLGISIPGDFLKSADTVIQ